MKNVSITTNGGILSDSEIQAYVDRGREVKPGQKLIGLDISIDGEYVDLAYTYDDRHILNSFNFNDPKVFAQYLNDIINVHSMDKNMRTELAEKIDNTCRILTLTTCLGGMPENRYLVQGVLVWEGTEEELDQAITDSNAEPETAPTVIPEATQ